jgi:hypothetical protein
VLASATAASDDCGGWYGNGVEATSTGSREAKLCKSELKSFLIDFGIRSASSKVFHRSRSGVVAGLGFPPHDLFLGDSKLPLGFAPEYPKDANK